MPAGSLSYAYGPFHFMPTGPLCLQALCFATVFVRCIDCLAHDLLSLLSCNTACHLVIIPKFLQLDMTSAPCLGSLSAPPHIVISISAPLAPPVPFVLHPPEAVAIKEAAVDGNDSTLEYWIEADEFLKDATNAVIVVNATMQYSCPSSRPGLAAASPNPLIGI